MRRLTAFFICLLATTASMAAERAYERDPEAIDREYPPGMIELQIDSAGAMMVGHLYTANGPGPHPTVVMLHGFPGNEKNLDTAQTLRRAGFNTLYFHYRGAWGSGGDYSLRHVTEDAKAAVVFIQEKGRAGAWRIDPDRISLVGHSLGGFNALITGAQNSAIHCTVAAAPADMINFVESADPEMVVSAAANTPVPGLKDYSFADLLNETLADKPTFNLISKMSAFKGRALMIVSGDRDNVVPPAGQHALADAAVGASPFKHAVLDGDHGFSWSRILFNRTITDWMITHCR